MTPSTCSVLRRGHRRWISVDYTALPLTTRDPFRLRRRSLQILRAHLLMGTMYIFFLLHKQSTIRPPEFSVQFWDDG